VILTTRMRVSASSSWRRVSSRAGEAAVAIVERRGAVAVLDRAAGEVSAAVAKAGRVAAGDGTAGEAAALVIERSRCRLLRMRAGREGQGGDQRKAGKNFLHFETSHEASAEAICNVG